VADGSIGLFPSWRAHIALRFGFPELVDPAERHRVNQSNNHLDVSIGSQSSASLATTELTAKHLSCTPGLAVLIA
jgi:hypothetical protein